MAQQNALGEIVPIVLIGGAAWVAWSLYQSYQAGLVAAAASAPAGSTPVSPAVPAAPASPSSTSTATPAAPAPSASPAIVIPAGFTVTPDINASYKGTVTYNGALATFNVILGNAGNSAGVVYNSAGQDVTALLGAANVATLVNAFQTAANNATITGVSGLGQFIRVPGVIPLRRVPMFGRRIA